MTTSEKVTKYSRFNQQIVKKSRAGMISMSMLSPSDYNKLSEEDKLKYNTAFTMLNVHKKYGSPEVVHRVEKAIKQRKEPLALKEFIKEFLKPCKEDEHRGISSIVEYCIDIAGVVGA